MKPIQFLKVNALAIAAVIVAGTTMSFKMAEKQAKETTTFFFYTSTAPIANDHSLADPARWSDTDSGYSCQTSGNLPCKIEVPEGETIDDVLSGLNNTNVMAISVDRKQP